MSDYDAIVIGAGHNGLTAGTILARGGMRVLCLEANTYSGGMASTVELMEGCHFEIAGSVQFPTASEIRKDLELDSVATIEQDVMSVNLGGPDDEPMVFYRDPMQLMTHLSEKHGADAVAGMAGIFGWSMAPTRALGRFDVRTPPKTLDEMYACANDESERAAITDMLFGSATDVLDRYFPDKRRHAVLRGLLAFLAVNSTFRGPDSPGSATGLAYGLAIPPDGSPMMSKLQGGIGALTTHLARLFTSNGGEIRYKAKVEEILIDDDRITGVRLHDGTKITAPIVVSNLSPDVTLTCLIDPTTLPADLVARVSNRDHRAAYLQMHFALDGLPEFAPPFDIVNEPGMQTAITMFDSAEEIQRLWEGSRRGIVPANPPLTMQIPTANDPSLAPEGKHAASVFAYCFPDESAGNTHGRLKNEMAQRIIDKITKFAPNFADIQSRHITFAPHHMETMFGCPSGDYCHGWIHPELRGPIGLARKAFSTSRYPRRVSTYRALAATADLESHSSPATTRAIRRSRTRASAQRQSAPTSSRDSGQTVCATR